MRTLLVLKLELGGVPMSGDSANDKDFVEIVATVQHRRRWSVSEKIRMLEDTEHPGMSVSFVARQNGIAPNLLFRWRKLVKVRGIVRPEGRRIGRWNI